MEENKTFEEFKNGLKARMRVLKKLRETAPGETVCLTSEEVATLLDFIDTICGKK